jgi:hydroxyacylglutathione hydrolase
MPLPPRPPRIERLAPGLRRVLAPNPSPLTHWGTNSYLVGTGRVALVDPGPDDPGHAEAIVAALEPGERISHILVTHAHRDHAPLARAMARLSGAPVLAFGDAAAGRRDRPGIAALGGGEGVDTGFAPDRSLADGEAVEGDDWRLVARHTPGHMGNHLCFSWAGALLSGDHAMGFATSLVSPPDGDMADYMASLARLAALVPATLYPGHGAPVPDGAARIAALIAHRRGREEAIREALATAPGTPAALARRIYHDVDPALLPAAARNVLAHLLDLADRGHAAADPAPGSDAVFHAR